jgi:hypothetical protein
MAKISMTCPFSNKACMECAVYRGRHLYLCFTKGYHGCEWDISRPLSVELRKTHGKEEEIFKRLTGSPASSRVIYDVEDLIEAEEFSRFKEKGEKHDT